jgi:hypothetical protein
VGRSRPRSLLNCGADLFAIAENMIATDKAWIPDSINLTSVEALFTDIEDVALGAQASKAVTEYLRAFV